MKLQNMSYQSLQQFYTELQFAIEQHYIWYNDLLRTLICKLPLDDTHTRSDAHRQCRFGQWYYNNPMFEIDHPDITAISHNHLLVHQLVRNMLINLKSKKTITELEFDNFSAALQRFRIELNILLKEIEQILASQDHLTLMINYASTLTTLKEKQKALSVKNQKSFLAMVDIDFMSKINEQHGQSVGDKILIEFAKMIKEYFDIGDQIFRYGGETFLILFAGIDLSHSFSYLDNLRKKIAIASFDIGLPQTVHLTASIGLAEFDLKSDVELSIEKSEEALKLAKKSGRNQTKIFNTELSAL